MYLPRLWFQIRFSPGVLLKVAIFFEISDIKIVHYVLSRLLSSFFASLNGQMVCYSVSHTELYWKVDIKITLWLQVY